MNNYIFIADAFDHFTGGFLLSWLGVLGALLAIAVLVKILFAKASVISPQPLVIALKEEFVAQHEFKKFEQYVHKSHHEIRNEVQSVKLEGNERGKEQEQLMRSLNTENEKRATHIHDRINDVLTVVSKLQGAFDQSQRRTR
jgi:hypothetical protein